MAYLCSIAIFLSAFLLFQIQPLIARLFLPWFGGIPSVWTTCMLFFECVLLAGYGYSHWMAQKVQPQRQAKIHCALLGCALLVLAIQMIIWGSPLLPEKNWAPKNGDIPLISLLGLLIISVGIPYLMTSTTGPLLQSWFARIFPGRSVYRLYALSNAGSLLALLSYPFLIEPYLRLRTQAILWGCGFLCFTILCAYFGIRGLSSDANHEGAESSPRKNDVGSASQAAAEAPSAPSETIKNQPAQLSSDAGNQSAAAVNSGMSLQTNSSEGSEASSESDRTEGTSSLEDDVPFLKDWLSWILLATIPSAALLAITSQITMEISPIPLLWIIPMVIYLGSFILTFDNPKFYVRPLWAVLLSVSAAACTFFLYTGHEASIALQLTAFLVFLGAACMLCHGEMARRKPQPKYLTGFYLAMSLGGALGGILVGVLAPLVFKGFWEVNFSIAAALLAMLLTMSSAPKILRGLSAVFVAVVSLALTAEIFPADGTLESFRDFYGKYNVMEYATSKEDETLFGLVSGKTTHGVQTANAQSPEPLSYYYRESGIGLLLEKERGLLKKDNLNLGLIGLGIGTLAAYAREGDRFDFYELNPAVIDLARGKGGYFSYLSSAKGTIKTFPGDGRLSLEQKSAADDGTPAIERYDILVLDAFSSDSIPGHLLTSEAFQIYLQRLTDNGIIAAHISNRYIDLIPVLQAAARRHSLTLYRKDDLYLPLTDGKSSSDWILMFRTPPEKAPASFTPVESGPGLLWMDDYAPILPLISWFSD